MTEGLHFLATVALIIFTVEKMGRFIVEVFGTAIGQADIKRKERDEHHIQSILLNDGTGYQRFSNMDGSERVLSIRRLERDGSTWFDIYTTSDPVGKVSTERIAESVNAAYVVSVRYSA
jgi:hypothetical protein